VLHSGDISIFRQHRLAQQLGAELKIKIVDGITKTIEAHCTHQFTQRWGEQTELIDRREILTFKQRAQLIDVCGADVRAMRRLGAIICIPCLRLPSSSEETRTGSAKSAYSRNMRASNELNNAKSSPNIC